MLALDKDVGHGALVGQAQQLSLDIVTVGQGLQKGDALTIASKVLVIIVAYIKFDDLVLDILALDRILCTSAIRAVGLRINGHLVGANFAFNFRTKAHVAVSIGVGISHRSENMTRFDVLCS